MKSEILQIPVADVLPTVSAILKAQGVPRSVTPDERVLKIADDALAIFRNLARPTSIAMEIEREEFEAVYAGEGENDDDSVVRPILANADHFVLYAVTAGEPVCAEIRKLFAEDEYPLGAMLDAAASEGTELTAHVLETQYRTRLKSRSWFTPRHGTLRFSPGYCGWHVSGQKKLFEVLNPGAIGIALNDSFLMQPIKSTSGVVITGTRDIFEFDDTFSFCRDCRTHTCRERILALADQ